MLFLPVCYRRASGRGAGAHQESRTDEPSALHGHAMLLTPGNGGATSEIPSSLLFFTLLSLVMRDFIRLFTLGDFGVMIESGRISLTMVCYTAP